MAAERFRHIFLRGPTRTQRFTNPRRGGSEPRIPDRDRIRHTEYLRQRLDAAWRQAEERHAVVHAERHGAYIVFASEPGFDLVIQSLEARRSGIRLLNVHKIGDPPNEQTLATVYVPHGRRGHFVKKITAYAAEMTKSGEPKNKRLVNSIADIRAAVLESFWQDNRDLLPGDTPEPVEVWLSSDDDAVIAAFDSLLQQLRVTPIEGVLRFPERTVQVVSASRSQLHCIIENSDDIAELRCAKEVATYYVAMENREQSELVRALLMRTTFDNASDVTVCILDTGVNNGHSLIQPVLHDDDLHAARQEWGRSDHAGHGTLMAGMTAYGNLLDVLNGGDRLRISHRLESAKILPPPPDRNPKRLWGYVMAQGIARAEIQAPQRKRIACMAVTSVDDRDRGRPSSWSAKVDEMTSGYADEMHRLVIVSAGNVDNPADWLNYPDGNTTNEVHDPGQAWNALTVGAFTEKTRIADSTLRDYVPVAPAGGLSPYSTTSTTWPLRKWPVKPEVVFEGGNVARGRDNSILNPDDLQLLSTCHDPQVAQFAPFSGTSAACAQATWIAARIQTEYPDAWPETIRALIVHTAQWTETMKRQFLPDESKGSYTKLLRLCGYGVPDLDRALYCAANSLTLISQTSLQPYDKRDGRYVTRDMHLYMLPWPSDVLSDLGEVQVQMRVTLSYFVEPGPGEVGWENRYRYASHALRFDINGPAESEQEFVQRVNRQARDDGEHPGTEGPGDRWVIGMARNVGSIHSDIWLGRAVDLAVSNKIAVYPAVGWWRERHHLNRWNKLSRYALVVSIHAPGQSIDIYTPVAVQVAVPIQIRT